MEGNVDMPNYALISILISLVVSVVIPAMLGAITIFVTFQIVRYRVGKLEDWQATHSKDFGEFRDLVTTLVNDVKWIRERIEDDEQRHKK